MPISCERLFGSSKFLHSNFFLLELESAADSTAIIILDFFTEFLQFGIVGFRVRETHTTLLLLELSSDVVTQMEHTSLLDRPRTDVCEASTA